VFFIQAQAMVEIVKQLGWSYVSTVAAQVTTNKRAPLIYASQWKSNFEHRSFTFVIFTKLKIRLFGVKRQKKAGFFKLKKLKGQFHMILMPLVICIKQTRPNQCFRKFAALLAFMALSIKSNRYHWMFPKYDLDLAEKLRKIYFYPFFSDFSFELNSQAAENPKNQRQPIGNLHWHPSANQGLVFAGRVRGERDRQLHPAGHKVRDLHR
jgi:hypothetical protein